MKKMLFQFFIKEKINKEGIECLLTKIFDTKDVGSIKGNKSHKIFYNHQPYKGEFKTSIELYVEEEYATSKNILSDKALGILVAESLNTSVLVSDDHLNPYTWLLIENGQMYEVEQVDQEENNMTIQKKDSHPFAL